MSEELLVFADDTSFLPDLVARAQRLRVTPEVPIGVAILAGVEAGADLGRGANQLYRLSGPSLRKELPETVAAALAELVRRRSPRLLLLPSTKRGREYAARLAGLLDAPVVTGVSEVTIDGPTVGIKREMLSGNALGEEAVSGRFIIVAVQGGGAEPAPLPSSPGIEEVTVEVPSAMSEVVERVSKPSGGVHLETSERIVSIGRGLQKKEDLPLIEELARRLGAAVGCTRPIAAESGWLSDDHWIGLTGHRVKPRLYVAVGISGAVQHLVGMRESKVVVAINKDANAPIFQQADYRVQGDLYQILPELTKLLPAR